MPQLAMAAASFTASAAPAVAATAAKVGFMTTLKSVAMNVLTNVAISAAMTALQPQVGAAGRTFEWTLDPDGPIPFAAGRIGVPGSAVYRKTFGPDLMYYGIPSVLSGAGPIDGFEGVKADDEAVTFNASGMAITSQYANELWYRNRLGTQPDTALVSPTGLKNGASLPGWTSAHKLSGKACYLLVMGENSKGTAYPTGEIKPIITFRGLKGWDPRLDSTYPGGSGPCRLNDPSTWVYLRRGPLWGLKWALGLWEGPTGKGAPQVDYQVGGIGAKLSGIDVPAFVAAENIAELNDWTVAAYPTTDDDKAQVLDAFLQASGCIYAQRAGKISCIQRAAPRTSIVTISAADTAGPLEIDTAASRIDRINTIRPRFWSEAHRWQLTAIDEVTAAAYQAEDGAKRTRGIDYPYVSIAKQAAQLAALQIANTREGIAGVIPLKPHLQRIRPGDAFTITEPGFVLNGLKCLCLNTDYDPATGVVRVSFVSETDAKYAFAMGQNPTPPAPPVLTPVDPTYVSPPEPGEWSLTAERFVNAGTAVPALVVAGAVANATAGEVIFEFRVAGVGSWTVDRVAAPTVTRNETKGLTNGTAYEVAVSYRRGNNYSARLILGPVTAGSSDATYGSGVNRLKLSSFERGAEGWGLRFSAVASVSALETGTYLGRRYLKATGTSGASGQAFALGSQTGYFARVTPGERISVQWRLEAQGAVDGVSPRIRYYDANGTEMTTAVLGYLPGPQVYGTLVQAFFDVPAGAFSAEVFQVVIANGVGAFTNVLIEPMIAGGNAGQMAHPPYSIGPIDLTAEVQWIDGTGRIVDGRGLPINASAGAAIVLTPSRPLAPGVPAHTAINVSALTATLVGGAVLSFPSASMAGLSPATTYALFRDLVAGAYVPVSGGTTAYFTSADRYLYLGTQTTAQSSGGEYAPPPPRPPGGGGGAGGSIQYV